MYVFTKGVPAKLQKWFILRKDKSFTNKWPTKTGLATLTLQKYALKKKKKERINYLHFVDLA